MWSTNYLTLACVTLLCWMQTAFLAPVTVSNQTHVTSVSNQTHVTSVSNQTHVMSVSNQTTPVQIKIVTTVKVPALKCESVLRNLELNPPPNVNITLREPVRTFLQARYRCTKGTFMENGRTYATRRCRNRKMSGRTVTCKPIVCSRPKPVPHASFTGKRFTYKRKIVYTCDKGYKMEGDRPWRMCKKNGKWSKKPRCVISQCKISPKLSIRHGTINTTDPEYKDGATLLFSCDNGYEIAGDDTVIECVDEKWSSYRLPYCKAIVCPDPTKSLRNGRFNGRNFRVNKTVEFFCNAGMKLIGSKKRTCQPNKLWSGSTTVCDDGNSYCPNPGIPISGRKIGFRYNFGSIVRFKCDYEYVLVGSAVRQCMKGGSWNGTEAVCMVEFQYMIRNSNNMAFMLKKNIDKMLEYTCSGINTTCNDTEMDLRARAINPKHAGGLDIVFVFDASSSITKKDFKLAIRFAQELVRLLGATWKPGGTHVAALTYGSQPNLEFNLGDASADTAKKVMTKLGKIKRSGGGTATRPALDMVIRTVVPNTRLKSQKTLFFITDGRSNIGESPEKAAKQLRKKGFEIYAVGVGKTVKRRELMSIASEPEHEHVLVVEKHKHLLKAVKSAINVKIDYSPCGESPTFFRARMVGSNKAGRGTWPWQVGLHKANWDIGGNLALICGGALINRQWVLTAAHCFYGQNEFTKKRERQIIPSSQYTIKVGDDHLDDQVDLEADEIYIHQDYKDDPVLQNDIALVKLTKKVKLGPFVRTVCLPKKGEDLVVAGRHGFVAGWGVTQVLKPGQNPLPKNANSKYLQHSAFTIQNNSTCAKKAIFYDNDVKFCAGNGMGGNDTCQGDSGGSFVRQALIKGEHRWVSVGLVSGGLGCGLKGQYGYYTRVEPFVDWIKKTIEDDEKVDD